MSLLKQFLLKLVNVQQIILVDLGVARAVLLCFCASNTAVGNSSKLELTFTFGHFFFKVVLNWLLVLWTLLQQNELRNEHSLIACSTFFITMERPSYTLVDFMSFECRTEGMNKRVTVDAKSCRLA